MFVGAGRCGVKSMLKFVPSAGTVIVRCRVEVGRYRLAIALRAVEDLIDRRVGVDVARADFVIFAAGHARRRFLMICLISSGVSVGSASSINATTPATNGHGHRGAADLRVEGQVSGRDLRVVGQAALATTFEVERVETMAALNRRGVGFELAARARRGDGRRVVVVERVACRSAALPWACRATRSWRARLLWFPPLRRSPTGLCVRVVRVRPRAGVARRENAR